MDSPDIDIDAVLASYVPLSQLPTPPPSSEIGKHRSMPLDGEAGATTTTTTTTTTTPKTTPRTIDPLHLRRAERLISLLPSNALYLNTSASVPAVLSFLERANLPDSILGLTACLLESLSNRFVRTWRHAAFHAHVQRTSVEAALLGALCIAAGFLDDKRRTAAWWSEKVARGTVGVAEINVAVRCVLLDIDYDVHSFTAEMIADALAEVTRDGRCQQDARVAGVQANCVAMVPNNEVLGGEEVKDGRSVSGCGGKGLWQNGLITPYPSPSLTADMPFLILL